MEETNKEYIQKLLAATKKPVKWGVTINSKGKLAYVKIN